MPPMTEAQAALLESLEPDRVVKQVQRTAVRVGKELAQRAPSLEAAALKWIDLFNKGKIVVEVDTSQLSRRRRAGRRPRQAGDDRA